MNSDKINRIYDWKKKKPYFFSFSLHPFLRLITNREYEKRKIQRERVDYYLEFSLVI